MKNEKSSLSSIRLTWINIETYLFDFSGDLYGAPLSVGLVDYLRPEEKFDGLDALINQMNVDCDQARAILAAL
jgi:riboflavin kinase/FMN adenylyltransferase